MKTAKKGKRRGIPRRTPWIAIAFAAVLALVAGYLLGILRARQADEQAQTAMSAPERKAGLGGEGGGPIRKEISMDEKEEAITKQDEREEECKRIQEEIQAFFLDLNKRDYLQEIDEKPDMYRWFQRVVKRLSAHAPMPAGEGLDTMLLTSNVFHFFRNLEEKDMRLFREIISKETPSLETKLDLFFRWVSLRGCPDTPRIRPSQDTLYAYAGFFINTIGGRAYLFRRPSNLRLLVTYYCLLILHEADRQGRNSYGIDVAPHVKALRREMALHTSLTHYRKYADRLEELYKYYEARR